MSEQSPYEKLGVTESASFDEIQDARNRLMQQHEGDRQSLETIEAAYDAVLMERLRMRQEGKIKVPDRIRFPEKLAQEPIVAVAPPSKPATAWLERFIDTPNRTDILLPAGIFFALGALSVFPQSASVAMAFGLLVSIYFLHRKEHKLGRAFLLTVSGSVIGVFVGLQLDHLLQTQLSQLSLAPETIAAWFTFLLLWLISSFMR